MDTTYRLTQTGAEVQNLLNQITPMAAEILAKYTKPVDGIPDTDLTAAIQQALALALTAYQKPHDGIPTTDLTTAVQNLLDAAGTAYQKPGSGIPKTDLATAVQNLLDAAGTAYQKPASGIPLTDLAASVQAAINASASMAQDLAAERLARETADLAINEALGTKLNQSQVESIVTAALANYDTAAEVATAISTALASYYTKAQSYSKTEVDTLVAPKQTQAQVEAIVAAALADYDTAAEVATAISTALAQYYTKAQTYTKTEVDGLVAPKQTQAQVEAIVSSALASYSTTSEVSAAIASALTDYYTKAAIDAALAGKQATLQFDQTPTLNSSNPVTSEGVRAAIATAVNGLVNSTYVQNAITTALADYSTTSQVGTMISTAINSTLQAYATKEYVSSQVQEYAGTFRGTFNSVADLEATTGNHHNDYAWVQVTDSDGDNDYDRYKYNGTAWVFEYRLNNTHFTSAQLAAISSGITSEKVTKLDSMPSATELSTINRRTRLADFELAVLKQAVSDQNLEKYGLKVGDYKTINGHDYVIAGLNPMKGTSTPYRLTQNHVGLIVIPHTTQAWNASGNTYTGADGRGAGYKNSDLHYYLKNTILPLVETDLGAANLLAHYKLLSNAVNQNGVNRYGEATGCSSGWDWEADCKICALSEVQVYGSVVWSSSGFDTGEACRQLDVFRHFNHTEIFGGEYPWLRDVASASSAASASNIGGADYATASYARYVAALILFN